MVVGLRAFRVSRSRRCPVLHRDTLIMIITSPAGKLQFWWNLGFLTLCSLILQLCGGIANCWFGSGLGGLSGLAHAATEYSSYWGCRGVHNAFGSIMFLCGYLHILRYCRSSLCPRSGGSLVLSGACSYWLTFGAAFVGYVLP